MGYTRTGKEENIKTGMDIVIRDNSSALA